MNDSTPEQPEMAKDELDADAQFLVGIGASAGGLEAIRELVKNLSDDLPATYVVVQHMSPDHKSLLTTLIARETKLMVRDVETGLVPEANTIYVTPPNADVVIRGGRLVLRDPSSEPASPKPSVDRFFISAAEAYGEKAVGLVLSGTGSDGAYGIQAIRAAGGITIAQDDKTAKYDGMPVAAVETGCTDLVLSPIQIGTHLAKILKSPKELDAFRNDEATPHPLSDLLQIVLARTRVDFREYKPTTIQRRLERRMNALGINKVQQYTSYCRSDPAEVDALFKDLLISVTRFFRDPKEFAAITPAIRTMVSQNPDRPLRIWIAGCATGEEAYSVAILFAEAMGGIDVVTKDRLQIFATDIDRNALNVARRGKYSRAALDDIPDKLVAPYFNVRETFIEVHSTLKDVILFSDHNLCQDPPVLHIDLICCRNLLIYFGVALQSRVLARMHFSLLKEGRLFLGTAESTTVSEDLFRNTNEEAHLYRKRFGSQAGERSEFKIATSEGLRLGREVRARRPGPVGDEDPMAGAMFDELARIVGKNALLLSDDHRILKVYGDLSRFVRLDDSTRLQFSVSMLQTELAREVRSLSTIALRTGERRRGVTHRLAGDEGHETQLEAFPLRAPALDEGFTLIAFHRNAAAEAEKPAEEFVLDGEVAQHVDALESELNSTREELQQTIEELETSNEELQSTNEELQSTNEELQATNEELETSNEELQSTNEELVTVNEELQVSAAELSISNAEQDAVFANVTSPMLILDIALQVTKANAAAMELFGLKAPFDRPHLSHCRLPPGFPLLTEVCNETVQLGKAKTLDVISEGRIFTLQCAPFYNRDGRLRGATLMFVESHQAEKLARELGMVFSNENFFYMTRTRDGTILDASHRKLQFFSGFMDDYIGANLRDLLSEESAQRVIAEDEEFLDSGEDSRLSIVEVQSPTDGKTAVNRVNRYRTVHPDEGEVVFAVVQDVSEEHNKDLLHKRELQSMVDMKDHIIANLPTFFMHRDRDGVILEASESAANSVNATREELLGRTFEGLVDAETVRQVLADDREFLDGSEKMAVKTMHFQFDGKDRYLLVRRVRKIGVDGEPDTLYSFTSNETDSELLRRMEAEVGARQALVMEETGLTFWSINLVSQRLFWSEGVYDLHGLTPGDYTPELESAIAFYHEDDRARVQADVEAAIEKGKPFEFEARLRRADGKVIPVHSSCRVTHYDGKPLSVVGIFKEAG